MKEAILSIMKDMREKDFIFNLGHGILPKTPTRKCRTMYRYSENL